MSNKVTVIKEAENGKDADSQVYAKMSEVSDGFHTFRELYHIRMLYNAALFNEWHRDRARLPFNIHKSYRHSDGELCFGKENYFVVVAQLPTGQITNHYKGEFWDLFKIPELHKALPWDGHTAQEAAERLQRYLETF